MSGLTKPVDRVKRSLASLAALVLLSCGGGPPPMPPLAPAVTAAKLVGPLCEGALCTCREDAAGKIAGKFIAGEPDPGFKRYEVRVGPSGNDLRVTVGPHQIYKSNERPTECFYLDLPVGHHTVTVRAHGDPSFGAALSISEMGSGPNPPWYESFIFECGTNVCSVDDLKAWRAAAAKLGPAHDPCGSTKISDVRYQTGSLPDGLHPVDLFLKATLQVYKFKPVKPPCR